MVRVYQVPDGMLWDEARLASRDGPKWKCRDKDYEILKTKDGKYRLISFDHDPSSEFPQAEFYMREFSTLNAAMLHAEGI